MTKPQKRKQPEKRNITVSYPGCRKKIYSAEDLRCVEYVRIKRKKDVFFRREGMNKIWR